MENNLNKLYLEDNDKKAIIKLNGNDITTGITEYSCSRNSENNNIIELTLKMIVIPEYIKIEKKNFK